MRSTPTPVFVVNAFCDGPFSGNPAAVVTLQDERDARWMQAVAAQMNLSETAFVVPQGDAFHLRWFTPTTEVNLCGHATLATARVLFDAGKASTEHLTFHTHAGVLAAERRGTELSVFLPRRAWAPAEMPDSLVDAVGVMPRHVATSGHDILLELGSVQEVRDVTPDFVRLAQSEWCVCVTARGEGDADFVSRYFAPSQGIPEDPVTGSTHSVLGPFWLQRLKKEDLVARQLSARGGLVRVHVGPEQVRLSGEAVLVLRGELVV